MKKLVSLIKACMTSDMNLFVIGNKNKNGKKKSKALPIAIFTLLMFCFFGYANMFMDPLEEMHLEYIVISLFVFITFLFTVIEGIYKSSSLLFNCKDDDLLLSLPLKRSTVIFVRIFKFYVFELLYNSIFMIPVFIAYALRVPVDASFYLVAFLMLLLLPIIPIVISVVIGVLTASISSRFKSKNLVQIIVSFIFLLFLMYISFNLNSLIKSFGENATSLNDIITRIYYPAGALSNLITDFKVTDLLIFIGINIGLSLLTIFLFSKVYFRINTRTKSIKHSIKNKPVVIKTTSPMKALIKKESKKFLGSPVFLVNAGFGLVLFLILCGLLVFKYDMFESMLSSQGLKLTKEQIVRYIPLLLCGFVIATSFLTSITSSMISLEGRSFNILKSLPVEPSTIILSKVLTAVLIMVPVLIVGDILIFINFSFNIIEMLLIIIASFVFPLISELIGIIMNLKYPKMNAATDAEVVKQSTSSTVSVFAGFGLIGLFAAGIILSLKMFSTDITLLLTLGIACLILLLLLLYMKKKSVEEFNAIDV